MIKVLLSTVAYPGFSNSKASISAFSTPIMKNSSNIFIWPTSPSRLFFTTTGD